MTQDEIIAGIEDVLERLETALDKCNRKLLRLEEAQQAIKEADLKLEELLPLDSNAFRIYDRSKQEYALYWNKPKGGSVYVDPRDCRNIEQWVNIVRDVINEYEPEFLRDECVDKKQYFIPAGDRYRAMKLLLKIMKRAKKSLSVVDPYLDEEIFDYIESLDVSVDIILITATLKPMFRKLYNALKTTRSNIEAKVCHDCHDRFLIVDATEVWHLGASINGIAKKASMVNKVIDLDECNRLLLYFNDWWSKGKII